MAFADKLAGPDPFLVTAIFVSWFSYRLGQREQAAWLKTLALSLAGAAFIGACLVTACLIESYGQRYQSWYQTYHLELQGRPSAERAGVVVALALLLHAIARAIHARRKARAST